MCVLYACSRLRHVCGTGVIIPIIPVIRYNHSTSPLLSLRGGQPHPLSIRVWVYLSSSLFSLLPLHLPLHFLTLLLFPFLVLNCYLRPKNTEKVGRSPTTGIGNGFLKFNAVMPCPKDPTYSHYYFWEFQLSYSFLCCGRLWTAQVLSEYARLSPSKLPEALLTRDILSD